MNAERLATIQSIAITIVDAEWHDTTPVDAAKLLPEYHEGCAPHPHHILMLAERLGTTVPCLTSDERCAFDAAYVSSFERVLRECVVLSGESEIIERRAIGATNSQYVGKSDEEVVSVFGRIDELTPSRLDWLLLAESLRVSKENLTDDVRESFVRAYRENTKRALTRQIILRAFHRWERMVKEEAKQKKIASIQDDFSKSKAGKVFATLSASGSPVAVPTKLRDGSWGLRGKNLTFNCTATVVKKTGKQERFRVGEILWTGPDGMQLATGTPEWREDRINGIAAA